MASSPSTTTNGACIWHPMPTGRATSSLGANDAKDRVPPAPPPLPRS
uniref:GM01211p n=1 Tax=Drosophila melanogaster TaxID=7227 RepID=Q95SE9_DROME|nr:GM01211p [Drosophila melanogaster]